MKKNLKIILLSSLTMGALTSIALPIVSCSGTKTAEELAVEYVENSEFENSIQRGTNELKKNIFPIGSTFEEQKNNYEQIVGKKLSSAEIKEFEGIYKFRKNDGKYYNWDDIVGGIEVVEKGNFPAVPNQINKVPPISLKISLKDGFNVLKSDEDKLIFKTIDFGTPTNLIAKVGVEKNNTFDVAVGKVTNKLTTSFASLKNFDNQKTIYDRLDGTKLDLEYNSLTNNMVIVKDTSNANPISWNSVFDSLVVSTKSGGESNFPTIPGDPIPPVAIKINLKKEYAVMSGEENLSFTTGVLGSSYFARTELNITDATDKTTIITAGSDGLRELFTVANQTFTQQSKIYNDLISTKLSTTQAEKFIGLVNFGNGNEWANVVESLTFLETTNPTLVSGGTIPALKIQINLKREYYASESTSNLLIFTTDTLGSFAQEKLTITQVANQITNIGAEIAKKFTNTQTISAQQAYYDSLSGENKLNTGSAGDNASALTALKSSLTFAKGSDSIAWNNAVEKYKITTSQEKLSINAPIPKITFTIILNSKYVANNDTEKAKLTFDVSNLGNGTLRGPLTVEKVANYDSLKSALEEQIKLSIDNNSLNTTIEQEKADYLNIINSTIEKNNSGFPDWAKLLTFKKHDSTVEVWEDSVKNITFSGTKDLSSQAVGSLIPSITMKINLNSDFTVSDENQKAFLSIEFTQLGKWGTSSLNVVKNDAQITNLEEKFKSKFSNTQTLAEQKVKYNSLINSANTTPENVNFLKETLKFTSINETRTVPNVVGWDKAVADYSVSPATAFPTTPGAAIPSVNVKVELNSGYEVEGNQQEKLTITLDNLGNASSEINRVSITTGNLETFKGIISSKFSSNQTFAEQETTYNGLIGKDRFTNDATVKTALEEYIKFNTADNSPGATSWGEVVASYTTTKGSAPALGGLIPNIQFVITLKEGWVSAEESLLTFNIENIGTFNSKLIAKQDGVKKGELKTAISGLFPSGQAFVDQEATYNSLIGSNKFDVEDKASILTILKQTITFDNGKSWENVVASYTTTKGSAPAIGGLIPDITFNITLKEPFTAEASSLTFSVTDIGNFGSKLIATKHTDKIGELKTAISGLFIRDQSFANQEAIYNSLIGDNKFNDVSDKVNILNILKETITFDNGKSWENVVASYTTIKGSAPAIGGLIPDITFNITLKEPFTAEASSLTFSVADLGRFSKGLIVTQSISKKTEIENAIKGLFIVDGQTFDDQKAIYNSLIGDNKFDVEDKASILNILKQTIAFDNGKLWNDVVLSYTTVQHGDGTLNSGSLIPDITFKITLKEEFTAKKESLEFTISSVGSFV